MTTFSFTGGNSASSYATVVQDMYVSYFGRPADPLGLISFEAALSAANAPTDLAGLGAAYSTNASVKALVDSFGTSAESAALYGNGGFSTPTFIDAIYHNLFNRAPDLDGLLYWSLKIDSGALTRGSVALQIAACALSFNSSDAATVTNKVMVASSFTTDVGNSSAGILSYTGSAAAASARALIAGVTSSNVEGFTPAIIQGAVDALSVTQTPASTTSTVYITPVAITNTVKGYSDAVGLALSSPMPTALAAGDGVVGNYSSSQLAYHISNKGELTFTGSLADSLSNEQKAGEAAALLYGHSNAVLTVTGFNIAGGTQDTFVVSNSGGHTSVTDLVGQTLHGVTSDSGTPLVHLVAQQVMQQYGG